MKTFDMGNAGSYLLKLYTSIKTGPLAGCKDMESSSKNKEFLYQD